MSDKEMLLHLLNKVCNKNYIHEPMYTTEDSNTRIITMDKDSIGCSHWIFDTSGNLLSMYHTPY